MTLGLWLLLVFLCRHALHLIVGETVKLFGREVHSPDPNWSVWAQRLRPYAVIDVVLGGWLVVWGSVSLRRLRQSADLPAPPDLSPAEEARNAGCSEEDLTDWRQPKIAVADLDPAGRVVVRPCPIKVADAPAILRTAPTLVSAEAEGLG